MGREVVGPRDWNRSEFAALVVKVDPIFTPVMTEGDELKLLAAKRVERMGDPKTSARIVRSRCIRLH